MDINEFWKFIHTAGKRRTSGQYAEALAEELDALPAQKVMAFAITFCIYHDLAFRNLLWTAARLMTNAVYSSEFYSFVTWLIGSGETVFRRALENPDTLAHRCSEGEGSDYRDDDSFYRIIQVYDKKMAEKEGSVITFPSSYFFRDMPAYQHNLVKAVRSSIRPHRMIDSKPEAKHQTALLLPRIWQKVHGQNKAGSRNGN